MGAGTARGQVLIASNRGPVSFTRDDDGTLSARRGGGGMVSGLSTVSEETDMLWVCAALSDADRAAARAAPGGLLDPAQVGAGAAVRMIDIPPVVFQRAYNAVANSTLWFVHHMLYDTPNSPVFGPDFAREWQGFCTYNEMFADALAEAAAGQSGIRAVIQDYHLCLAPRMLAQRDAGIQIAHFSHTPWAPPAYYRMLPADVGREVLAGILGADHAGFLCQRWADSFVDCCEAILGAEADRARSQVAYRGHVTSIGVHSLGVDAGQLRARAGERDVLVRRAALADATAGRKLIVRVDRTELSKNIVRGLEAYRELLRTRPQWRRQVVHVAFAYPSRTDLAEYREYTQNVERLAAEISAEFAEPGWDPLMVEVNDDYPRSLAACRLADVLLVNPYDVSATADALHAGLSMPTSERRRRSAAIAAAAQARAPKRWLAEQLDVL